MAPAKAPEPKAAGSLRPAEPVAAPAVASCKLAGDGPRNRQLTPVQAGRGQRRLRPASAASVTPGSDPASVHQALEHAFNVCIEFASGSAQPPRPSRVVLDMTRVFMKTWKSIVSAGQHVQRAAVAATYIYISLYTRQKIFKARLCCRHSYYHNGIAAQELAYLLQALAGVGVSLQHLRDALMSKKLSVRNTRSWNDIFGCLRPKYFTQKIWKAACSQQVAVWPLLQYWAATWEDERREVVQAELKSFLLLSKPREPKSL